jgi:hypothetical protein
MGQKMSSTMILDKIVWVQECSKFFLQEIFLCDCLILCLNIYSKEVYSLKLSIKPRFHAELIHIQNKKCVHYKIRPSI